MLAIGTDGPALVTIENDATLGVAHDIIQGAIIARVNVDVRHALDRHAVEGSCAVGAATALEDASAGANIGFFNHLAPGDGAH
ncbi:MAG: hypothetical protein BWY63_03102 [Chloroflexi bacterium ADurb.Bin360]|nr:MAG: hypothetical protein BWY63_03102 [Chloroflexi bacterium ADurb.Bin360]